MPPEEHANQDANQDQGGIDAELDGSPTVACALCGRLVEQHASYVVRIDVFADPSMPPLTSAGLAATNFDQSFEDLAEQMKGMTEEELQDDVHRRFEYSLCRPCQRVVLSNPLGMPRKVRAGTN